VEILWDLSVTRRTGLVFARESVASAAVSAARVAASLEPLEVMDLWQAPLYLRIWLSNAAPREWRPVVEPPASEGPSGISGAGGKASGQKRPSVSGKAAAKVAEHTMEPSRWWSRQRTERELRAQVGKRLVEVPASIGSAHVQRSPRGTEHLDRDCTIVGSARRPASRAPFSRHEMQLGREPGTRRMQTITGGVRFWGGRAFAAARSLVRQGDGVGEGEPLSVARCNKLATLSSEQTVEVV
jgi:hypothetical protein